MPYPEEPLHRDALEGIYQQLLRDGIKHAGNVVHHARAGGRGGCEKAHDALGRFWKTLGEAHGYGMNLHRPDVVNSRVEAGAKTYGGVIAAGHAAQETFAEKCVIKRR